MDGNYRLEQEREARRLELIRLDHKRKEFCERMRRKQIIDDRMYEIQHRNSKEPQPTQSLHETFRQNNPQKQFTNQFIGLTPPRGVADPFGDHSNLMVRIQQNFFKT